MPTYFRMNSTDYNIEQTTGVDINRGHGALIVLTNGVLVTAAVLEAMRVHPDYAPVASKWGRTNLYRITIDTLIEAERMANYPRRSTREQAVADRGRRICNWLLDHLAK